MHPIAIIVFFFMVLAAFIAGTALAQRKSVRLISAAAAFGWACLMFVAAGWAESLNYNAWYSNAASKMLDACIGGIEQGRQDAVLAELRRMTNELHVTYEQRGNFRQLAERAAVSLATTNAGPSGAANRSQPVRSETNPTSGAAGSAR
jgi:hypothetical protein